jgi:hypothetical protein
MKRIIYIPFDHLNRNYGALKGADPKQDVIAAAPHMHLLGRTLKLILNPGTSTEKTLLNVTNYNFDDQYSTILKSPVPVKAGDPIRVECSFDPTLRQKIPQLKSLAPRYVTWGEGSSDEMCLGVIAATKA